MNMPNECAGCDARDEIIKKLSEEIDRLLGAVTETPDEDEMQQQAKQSEF